MSDLEISYQIHRIKKSSGGYRVIEAPNDSLKALQSEILSKINHKFIHFTAHGFIPGRGIWTNARVHKKASYILNIDLKNFFPSIQRDSFFYHSAGRLFSALGEDISIVKDVYKYCFLDGRLPQGAPTSPALSNFYMYNLDTLFYDYAIRHNLRYTRYADDMTFSSFSYESICGFSTSLLPYVKEAVSWYGLLVHPRKVALRPYHQQMKITGLSINNGEIRAPREKRERFFLNVRGRELSDLNEEECGLLAFFERYDRTFCTKLTRHLGGYNGP
jgi:RNA-directed DNA polymerase